MVEDQCALELQRVIKGLISLAKQQHSNAHDMTLVVNVQAIRASNLYHI